MKIISHPSPNHGARRSSPTDMLILHYTVTELEESLRLLTEGEVSCHWLIDRDGTCYHLVEEELRAWHAGVSEWQGETDINSRSIGIELVNSGKEPFPEQQIAALLELAGAIVSRHPIPPERVLGHEHVAPGRKQDPGPLFPWERLIEAGIAKPPNTSDASSSAQ